MAYGWLIGIVVCLAACDAGGDGPTDCSAADLASKLHCTPGLTITATPDAGVAGYQRFDLTLTQPVDHAHPDAGTFTQRLVLFHISDAAPMVLFTTGYGRPSNPTLTEAARIWWRSSAGCSSNALRSSRWCRARSR